jgi:hypothetical protein
MVMGHLGHLLLSRWNIKAGLWRGRKQFLNKPRTFNSTAV